MGENEPLAWRRGEAFLKAFEAWSRHVAGQPLRWDPQTMKVDAIIEASNREVELRAALPDPAEVHGLYPGFEALGGAWAPADTDGAALLMGLADLAAREAVSGDGVLNWLMMLRWYGPAIVDPMLALLREAATSGGAYWCRWEDRADGDVLRWAGPVGPDLPAGHEEARLTFCSPDDDGATWIKQVWFDLDGLTELVEEREERAQRARRGLAVEAVQ